MSKIHVSYNQIHSIIKETVDNMNLNDDFQPDIMVAIGGGGFIPGKTIFCFAAVVVVAVAPQKTGLPGMEGSATECRTFLKKKNNKNISIQAIGLSLYEDLEIWKAAHQDQDGGPLTSEPEVIKTQWLNFDSSETSLIGRNILIVDEVDDTRRTLAYALKEKREELPEEIMKGRYFACREMPDQWLVYPWDALDIEDHTEKSRENTY
ncbi:hypoxanthine-guanine phosphoribosyltransferase [Mortierella sp. AD011]|nr:hypoxanthine-guanine phosphoribosyltransferase [Mortierella sp. AD011]